MRSQTAIGRVRVKAFVSAAAAAAALGMAGASHAAGLDGWSDAPDGGALEPDTVLTPVTDVGVTNGSGALRVEVPNGVGVFWGPMTGNVGAALAAGATTLSFDLTLINVELNGGSFGGGEDNSFNGYAQSNELAVVVATNAPGNFIQRNFTSGNATDTSGQAGQWRGVDGARTITWDLTTFTAGGMSVADYMAANNATDAYIWFPTQAQDSNGHVGPARFYFDNVKLLGPGQTETLIGDFETPTEPWRVADANDDGKVDVADLGILATNYNEMPPDPEGRMGGDFNNDGVVNVADLGILATHYGQPRPAALAFEQAAASFNNLPAVPEPASLAVLGIGALGLTARWRQRR